MLGVDFTGRLGNQLFTYAFARALMELQPGLARTFVANFKRCGDASAAGWGDGLQAFNIVPYTTSTSDLILEHGSLSQRISYLLYMLCSKMPFMRRHDARMAAIESALRRKGMHFTGAADAAYTVDAVPSKVFVRGYFQDRRFFDSIRPILLEELTPKLPPLEHNAQLCQVIARPDTVCVSVRRGDYLSAAYKKDFYVCTPQYYRQAISIIRQRVAHPVFVFFSDDIAWVRAHMDVAGCQCYYERGDDPAWETLRLMYSCHHFIISNSTFAWWAQYLGRREGKLVVCPSRWFANPQWHSNLIADDFLFVEV